MQDIIYLKDGSKASLVQKVNDDKFIIRRFMYYEGYEGGGYEELSEVEEVVDCILSIAPSPTHSITVMVYF